MAKHYLGDPMLMASGHQHEYTAEELIEFEKCMNDPVHFISHYVKIVSLDHGLITFVPFEFQEKLIRHFDENRFSIVKMPRQHGKTITVAAYLLWYALFHPFVKIAILANLESKAFDILRSIKQAYRHLPPFLKIGVKRWNEGDISLDNDSSIEAYATTENGVRGGSCNILYLDEFAFVPNNISQQFYTSSYPVITTGTSTKVIITSTPRGMNLFWQMWEAATNPNVAKKSNYKAYEIHWSDYPGHDQKWADDIKAGLQGGETQWNQEFECQFLGSVNTLINPQKLKLLSPHHPGYDKDGMKIYHAPEPEHQYVLVADVAEGKGQDYSAFQVIDVSVIPYRQVATYRSNTILPLQYPDVIFKIATHYNEAQVLIEVGLGEGSTVANYLYHDKEYGNMVLITPKNGIQRVGGGFAGNVQLGVKTNGQIKRSGCSNLKTMIENDMLEVVDADTISELSNFVSVGNTYKADASNHDDLAMGLVLFGWLTTQQYFKELTDTDLRTAMLARMEQAIEDDVTPFGIIDNGLEEDVFSPGSGWLKG